MDIELAFSAKSPPLSVIAAARIAGISISTAANLLEGSAPIFRFAFGLEVHNTNTLLRYLGRVAALPNFYGRDALESAQIDEWLDYAPTFSSGPGFEVACEHVDDYLALRTFLVGYSFSIADIAIWSSLAGTGQRWKSLTKSKKYQNLVRWFNSVAAEYSEILTEVTTAYVGKRGLGKSPAPITKQVVQATNKASNGELVPKERSADFEVELDNAKVSEVCLRFAPEPSGYLHIGHTKAALLNQYFAQRYGGRLIIRFDDTNPSKENNEFVDNILIDIATLGIKYNAVTYTSDYFPQLMEMAERLICSGKAYVDDTPREAMQKERLDGIESKSRNNSVDENLALWKEMVSGSERGLQCCLRGKLDMNSLNKALRDPVYYRCNPVPHHRVGSKYKVYPTYDFACPFVDSTEGISHALRSSEYHDRNVQYDQILEDMGLRKVKLCEFSRLNMVYTLLSKRKLLWFVQNKKVDGWDDPRFPTVQGIVRRGLKVEALIQFILQQGASMKLNLMEWDKLWTINKKIIDPVCPRHTAVIEKQRVMFRLINAPQNPSVCVVSRHEKYMDAGLKATTCTDKIWIDYADALSVSEGEEVALMDWGNAVVKEIKKDAEDQIIELVGVLHLEGSVKATNLKLTWLPHSNELVNLSLVEFDYLICKKKLDKKKDDKKKGDNFLDYLNPCTRRETAALGDSNMRNVKRGEILQLKRKGYFRCDIPYLRASKPIVLLAIPDGRQQTSLN